MNKKSIDCEYLTLLSHNFILLTEKYEIKWWRS